ncbi:ash family protein [Ewingella sp. S1.OA.A_B6]
MNLLEPLSQRQRLTWSATEIYDIIFIAAAQSAAEFRSSFNLKAAPHVACAVALIHLLNRWLLATSNISMVAQAGQPSGWPVAFRTGTANLVWATTNGFRSSRGSD